MRGSFHRLAWLVSAAAVTACTAAGSAPDFTLQDDVGSRWTLSQQQGEVVLLTFGFTHCADTCPATLAKLSRLTGALGRASRDVEIAFVTIDPGRDTAPVMRRYLARFAHSGDSKIVGLTGTPQEVERVKIAYHIWSQPTPHDIAHTAVIFLIDPHGRIGAVRNDDDPQGSLARAVAGMLPAS